MSAALLYWSSFWLLKGKKTQHTISCVVSFQSSLWFGVSFAFEYFPLRLTMEQPTVAFSYQSVPKPVSQAPDHSRAALLWWQSMYYPLPALRPCHAMGQQYRANWSLAVLQHPSYHTLLGLGREYQNAPEHIRRIGAGTVRWVGEKGEGGQHLDISLEEALSQSRVGSWGHPAHVAWNHPQSSLRRAYSCHAASY